MNQFEKLKAEPTELIATVVIPTYHRPDMLRQCLESVARARAQAGANSIEVIVSDDSRDARSQQLVETDFPWVRYVQGPRRGPAANRNCGARHARAPWLIFTDDDCIAEPSWLTAYLHAFEKTCGTELFEGRTRADRSRQSNLEESPVNETGGYLWSCNMAISERLYRQMNGFCESFPHPALEDVDMRLRLHAAGQRATFLSAATVCHPYRPRKGLDFIRQHNASYVHLLNRHPEIWQSFTWWGIATYAVRLALTTLKDSLRYGIQGSGQSIYAAVTKLLIDARFKMFGTHKSDTAAT
jgi:GT2 family glycosyltransferase